MKRRQLNHALMLLTTLWGAPTMPTWAAGLSNAEASDGVRETLAAGARQAVLQLGVPGGFLDNPKVRIGLPGALADAEPLLRAMGQGKRIDELTQAMNRAAEQAIPLAADVLANAVRGLTLTDAARILGGGETSVTDFFADKTRLPLREQFLPVVRRTTAQLKLADRYDAVASKASRMGLLKPEDADLPGYVTGRTLEGLYLVIGEEERKMRSNPAASGSALLKKVFGSF